jgi:DNA-directed RNA polymerase specialized sigma24 family protein
VDQLACDRAEARTERILPELWGELTESVTKLEPRLRNVVLRVEIEGMSYTKAAKVLGIDRHLVSMWHLEGLAALRLVVNSDACKPHQSLCRQCP